ncbi:MAG: tRNA pseudouridine(38-40) synthase TruA [Bacteroidota bacterium]
MRYCLHLSYLGAHFHGWQWQPNVRTVQQVIEDNLAHIQKTKIGLVGCGRTDAGVHASDYYCHFNLEEPLVERLVFKLNHALPRTIAIHSLRPVAANWHARFSATARAYVYRAHARKDPFKEFTSTLLPYEWEELDLASMQAATQLFTQYEDFRAFCKVPDKHNHTRCRLDRAELTINAADQSLRLDIRSNRFLQGMIRLIMSHLLNVGLGKLSVADIAHCLRTGERSSFFKMAPPQGLTLCQIEYPPIPYLSEEE